MKASVFFKRLIILAVLLLLIDFSISKILLVGLEKYYGFGQNAEIFINGSSMTGAGIDKNSIELETQNQVVIFARFGASVDDRFAMINYFYSEYPKSAKTVIYEVNPLLFSGISTADNVYTLFYPFMDNSAIDEYIKAESSVRDYYMHKWLRTTRYDVSLFNLSVKGYLGAYSNIKTTVLDTTKLSNLKQHEGEMEVSMNPNKIAVFENTMKILSGNGAKVYLVMMPIYYLKNQTFDSVGLQKLYDFYEHYQATHENIVFKNFNQGEFSTRFEFFSDPLHLNREGQKELTKSIIDELGKQ